MVRKINKQNNKFIDSAYLNDLTYIDYKNRFEKLARSIFEWQNLPNSMNARWLERTLYYFGQATLLFDKTHGYINTQCTTSGDINIYGLPTKFNCHSFEYNTYRNLYTGKTGMKNQKETECVLVQNNWESVPTYSTMDLFALRLYEAERTIDTNIKAMKTPVLLLVDEKQRLTLENMYTQYDGNQPVIFGDRNNMTGEEKVISCINTDAPYIADKVTQYKKEIWNEALTFLRYK